MTASNTSDGGPAWATRVATRRRADCSSDSRADRCAWRRDRAANSPTTTAVTRNTAIATESRNSATPTEWIGGTNR